MSNLPPKGLLVKLPFQRHLTEETPAHLDACDQLLHALLWWHVNHGHHVTLPSEVTLQAGDGLVGRLVADVSDHHWGALRSEPLTHSSTNPAASPSNGRKRELESMMMMTMMKLKLFMMTVNFSIFNEWLYFFKLLTTVLTIDSSFNSQVTYVALKMIVTVNLLDE